MKHILLFCLISFSYLIQGQNASVTSGCIPLQVDFSSEMLGNYYWVFQDGTTSQLQNPTHIFTSEGDYLVELFEGVGGTAIGTINIKVYPDPVIEITADKVSGCVPLTTQFMPNVTVHEDIDVLSYLWSFGDGQSSSEENPFHNFNSPGSYTISLAITTSITECDKTVVFPDFVIVKGTASSFTYESTGECDAPSTFTFTNTSEQLPGTEYLWDFGNGSISSEYNPDPVLYDNNGSFEVTLSVTNEEGCTAKSSQFVVLGKPPLMIDVQDTVCINTNLGIVNTTPGGQYFWVFGNGSSVDNSFSKVPAVRYSTAGLKEISLSVFYGDNCSSDTSFMVFVEDPTAHFTIAPYIGCLDPVELQFIPDNPDYANYSWDSLFKSNEVSPIYDYVPYTLDSFTIHWPDTLNVYLEVETASGCISDFDTTFVIYHPRAHLEANIYRGCAPLNVTFSDYSTSEFEIVKWIWLLDDGTELEAANGDDVQHTYTEPGEYYPKLIIEDKKGCRDTSYGIWIYVGEKIQPEYTLDLTEICLYDSIRVELLNNDDRIDAWHASTDSDRSNHCWTGIAMTHHFLTAPGQYDLDVTVVYNGCYNSVTESNAITVNGVKADIEYMTNCVDPYSVMFTDASLGPIQSTWTIEDTSYTEAEFHHQFDTTGNYFIHLDVADTEGLCPNDTDTLTVNIRDIKADFVMPDMVCQGVPYELNNTSSIDVDTRCNKGFTWHLPDNRPRRNAKDTIMHSFSIPGENDVTLITEDMNGCQDTIKQTVRVYELRAEFEVDKTRICFPADVQFTDLSTHDTTIISYTWSTGFNIPDPLITFTDPLELFDPIQLNIQDALGCTDSFVVNLQYYEPQSQISMEPGPGICIGETIDFMASDFTSEGSNLEFEWNFGTLGTSDLQNPSVTFNDSGQYPIILNYTEVSSGCDGQAMTTIDVVKIPEASFTTSVDNDPIICHPQIIEFTNTSDTEGQIFYNWNFGNGQSVQIENPATAFTKGTFTITLDVISAYGCSDQITKEITLVGPEGEIVADRTAICKGEEITFSLVNPVDVNGIVWDFGDGTIQESGAIVTHVFDFFPPDGTTIVNLVLTSDENGCETIEGIPINIALVIADFEQIDTSLCPGEAIFNDVSIGADIYNWDFGDGNSDEVPSPTHIYSGPGIYDVTLSIEDEEIGCRDEITRQVEIEPTQDLAQYPNLFTPNNDGTNDFFLPVINEIYKEAATITSFQIYNRWGNLVYDNDDKVNGWDGRFKDKLSPAEVYAYYIEVALENCLTSQKKGNVTLMR